LKIGTANQRHPFSPERFFSAQFDPRVHASREEIAKSLEGNWRPELLFVLQQEVDMYSKDRHTDSPCHHASDRQYRSHAFIRAPEAPVGSRP
jgi:hypothetical protein